MSLGPVMLDVEGTSLSPADRDLLIEPAVGGVILFSRNYESPAQLADLVAEIRNLRSPALLVAVDHEGGRVQRFRDGFSRIPAMQKLGHEYDQDPERARGLARTAGWLAGSELRAAGIDLGFAPCLDLDWGVSEIIGDRAFHRQPDVVSVLATAYSRGLQAAGMAAVGKHFPGHGAVVADSHLKLPIDRRDYGNILDDMRPYERMVETNALAGVMLAHVVYRNVDELPAGFSSYWIGDELRRRIGFSGAVFCDDLSMKATLPYGDMVQRANSALRAGCDMILICNDRVAAEQAVTALRDYSNPLSLVRLARLRGMGKTLRETLLASDAWQAATRELDQWLQAPSLELGA
jgi:beta-N-acetylhexosaminidase